jgi:UDP-N-acetylglucosamine 2-epimerase (non-hydrolysing)
MPEELNRLATDALADLLWTPSVDADENLLREGIPADRIERVGNIMIDSLEMMRSVVEQRRFADTLGLSGQKYGIVTLHRPSNVDDAQKLNAIIDALTDVGTRMPVVFPLHPRTRQRLSESGALKGLERSAGIRLTEPLGYIDFMSLVFGATFALTDSGGIQEETTYLRIPCLTLRDNTERPITVTQGTNRLIKIRDLAGALNDVLSGAWPKGRIPELWDGHTALRVVQSLKRISNLPSTRVA